jgi:hypothetical protein
MKIKKTHKWILYLLVLGVVILTMETCKTHYFRSNYKDANKLLHDNKNLLTKPFLKAHLKNGDVSILRDTWKVDTRQNAVSGKGNHYDFNRKKIYEGKISIPIDSVAIFETNRSLEETENSRITGLTIMAGLDVAMGVFCLLNPKACFGSCPTFYIIEHDNLHYADAEGFSSAVAPSLEYFDIDALDNQAFNEPHFSITMKNEALETHCLNNVNLMVYPVQEDERVYQTPSNTFYLCKNNYPLSLAKGPEGTVTSLLVGKDIKERISLADENNMSSKEEICLEFNNVRNSGDLGLLISFRQTLMTTYIVYSALGYMGNEVGDLIAKMEMNNRMQGKLTNGLKEELGDIEVYVWNESKNSWEFQDGFYETGPIALNDQMLPLKNVNSSSEVRIKLVLNKGLWRIDYLALTNIKKEVKPIEIKTDKILNEGKTDHEALNQINTSDQYLISMPGSGYRFNFTLPKANQKYELFLYTKGYYLEWMRENWIKNKNLLKLRQLVENPAKYLRLEAKSYKIYEKTMEQEFWNTRINTDKFEYDEK